MSLYALTLSGIQRLKRQMFGTKITDQNGNQSDTAVQPFVNELIAALSDQNAIDLPSPLLLNAPGGNGPAIIINRISTSNINNDNSGAPITNINGGVIRFIDQNNNIIDMPGPNGSPINIINADGSHGANGLTTGIGVVTAISGATVTVVGCTATVTVNVITLTLQFANGLLIGVQ